MTNIDVLKTALISNGLSDADLEKLATICTEQSYAEGQLIFAEGEKAENLYVLVEGRVILQMRVNHGPYRPSSTLTTVDEVTKGESFGWSAVVEPHVYTLSAVCIAPSRVLAMRGERLRELLDQDQHLGYQVMKGLSRLISSRLTHTRRTLISERGLGLI